MTNTYRCFRCKHELIWNSTEARSDVFDEDDDDSIVEYYSCPHCGMEYEIAEPNKDMRDDLPYYK